MSVETGSAEAGSAQTGGAHTGSGTAYLDTSALAKWYVNERGSERFVAYVQALDSAAISSLTCAEMRSLFARRRRMGDFDAALEAVLFSAFLDDIASGALLLHPMDDARFNDAVNLIGRYPEHPLRTLDALHLSVVRHLGIDTVATADAVMADAARSMGFVVDQF